MTDPAPLDRARPVRAGEELALDTLTPWLLEKLPELHAPLTSGGKGIQGGRLLEIPDRLARALLQLAGGSDPARLVNPDWQPHQLRFGFAEQDEAT